jgi:hypothetical protein
VKNEESILGSRISDDLKEQFRNGKNYNRIRGLTVTYANNNDIEDAKKLIELKVSIK